MLIQAVYRCNKVVSFVRKSHWSAKDGAQGPCPSFKVETRLRQIRSLPFWVVKGFEFTSPSVANRALGMCVQELERIAITINTRDFNSVICQLAPFTIEMGSRDFDRVQRFKITADLDLFRTYVYKLLDILLITSFFEQALCVNARPSSAS